MRKEVVILTVEDDDGHFWLIRRNLQREHLQRLIVTFRGPPPACPPKTGLRVVHRVNRQRVEYAVAGEVTAALRWLAEQQVANVEITWPRMEEVFLSYYRDQDVSVSTAPAAADRGEGGGR